MITRQQHASSAHAVTALHAWRTLLFPFWVTDADSSRGVLQLMPVIACHVLNGAPPNLVYVTQHQGVAQDRLLPDLH